MKIRCQKLTNFENKMINKSYLVLRTSDGTWLCGFSGFSGISNNLHVELLAIMHGLKLTWERGHEMWFVILFPPCYKLNSLGMCSWIAPFERLTSVQIFLLNMVPITILLGVAWRTPSQTWKICFLQMLLEYSS